MKRVVSALTDKLAHAVAQTAPGLDAAAAVHELRRALRAARALVELVPDADDLAAGLRRAHKAAGGLRDDEIVAETLGELAEEDPRFAPLLALAEKRRSVAHTRVPVALGKLAAQLAGLQDLAAGLDDRAALELRRTGKRLRRALEQAEDEADFESAHRLRRRIKTAAAQIGLLHPEASDFLARADRAGKALGGAADLAATLAFAEKHRAARSLTRILRERLEERRAQGVRRARKLPARFPGPG
jgi:hypothetical protein